VVGVALRWVSVSDLWLDEALSVNIASLPLGRLQDALMRDGAPPLYYALLHFWIDLFGSSTFAVRSLSALISTATLALMWFVAVRERGRELALPALLLLASSPFAIRYASEARMYSLLAFLALLGYVAVRQGLERPSITAAAGVALVTGALVLTHYWSFYLVVFASLALAVDAVRRRSRPHALALAAIASGLLLFLPWLPTFLFQIAHTGTPWSGAPTFNVLVTMFDSWAGGASGISPYLSLLLMILVALGVAASRGIRGRVEVPARPAPPASRFALLTFVPTTIAIVAGLALGSGFSERYTSLVLPFGMLLAACGVERLPTRRIRAAALALTVALGLVGGGVVAGKERTQAGEVAAALTAHGATGDVVVYCPDQLGPAVTRLLPPRFEEATFPSGASPRFVDWVDYEARNEAANAVAFARTTSERAAGRTVWLVASSGYRTFGFRCERLADELGRLRVRETLVWAETRFAERASLIRYAAR